MIYRLSCRLAAFCVTHDIIDQRHFPHLQYKAETLLRTTLFSCSLALLALITRQYLEICTFALTTYLFRKHMGGWHAANPWLCQLLSFGIILLITLLIGPIITQLPKTVFFFLSIVLDSLVIILPPAYPSQLHLSVEEAHANIKRKNHILALVVLVQFLAFLWFDFRIVIYTSLGLATTVITVLLEKTICLKKGCRVHENTERSCQKGYNSVH